MVIVYSLISITSHYHSFWNLNFNMRGISLIWKFWICRMGFKLASGSEKALHWKSLWINIVINIVWMLTELVCCSTVISSNQSRLLLRFVFTNISSLLSHLNISYILIIINDRLIVTILGFLLQIIFAAVGNWGWRWNACHAAFENRTC